MNRAHLFRLGMDLETGATHEEETTGDRAICAVAAGASMTQPAPTISVAARGPSPSDAVLDNGAPPDGPLIATSEHALRGAPASDARIDRASEVGDALLDPARHDHFIRRGGKVFAGVHLIIEVIDGRGLDDEARVQQAFRDCITASGATLLHIHTHKFSPQGVSGVAVLSESHISVHTWPEIGYGAFDVFMCGDADPWASVPVLKRAFQAREVRVQEFLRGEGLVD